MKTFKTVKKNQRSRSSPHLPLISLPSSSSALKTGQSQIRSILHPQSIQTKLTIGSPNDQYEQEADRVADRVMRMPEPKCSECPEEQIQTKPIAEQITPLVQRQVEEEEEEEPIQTMRIGESAIQRQVEEEEEEEPIQTKQTGEPFLQRQVEEEEEEESIQTKTLPDLQVQRQEEEEEEPVQTKADTNHTPEAAPDLASSIKALRGGGRPLPHSERSFFEPRFGRDFSGVHIHTDPKAAEAARAVNSRAFTTGRDVVFGEGQYTPGTTQGRRLLGHELTHVVQQGKARNSPQSSHYRFRSSAPKRLVILESHPKDSDTIRRVKWYPNKDTNIDKYPWGIGPKGDVLKAKTDAGGGIFIWKPHDGKTYWCHGYTFGGSTAKGGPYSIWGQTVPKVLKDDGWKRVNSCLAAAGDILVFFKAGAVKHTGIISSVSAPDGQIDESKSKLKSKWGQNPLNTSSWLTNAKEYGKYVCYSKKPAFGPCKGHGANEWI